VFPLRKGANVLGRDIGDVSFPSDRSVSARHARLTVDAAQAMLEDLGSSNGTFVRLSEATSVRAGDQLLVGSQLLRIEAIA
jgi:pSer/pThr/pTyr-binding forkhead associated (FHA) protein